MAGESGGTRSVSKAFELLKAFAEQGTELRVSDLSRKSGLGQSTVSRLLGTLESVGYVERDPNSGLYRLGRDFISLAGVALNQSPVYREARQVAQDVACSLGLGVNVAERRNAGIFYLLHAEGRLAPRSFTLMGRTNPLHATGLGKSLISELSRKEIESLFSEGELQAYTPHTITEYWTLHEKLAEVRSRGYATELEELAFGRACVAAPIRDGTSQIVAAVSISGSLSALDLGQRESELANAVIETADQISVGLGHITAPGTQTSRLRR